MHSGCSWIYNPDLTIRIHIEFQIEFLDLFRSRLIPSDHFLLQCSALGEPQKLRIIYGNFSFGKTIE
ncbi:hypothetical protein D9M69_702150 [compost metagenome]